MLETNGKYDWFLPSEAELVLMYENLQSQGLGNFTGAKYWSSTEADAGNSQTVNFVNGNVSATPKIPTANTVKTRAVRYF